MYGVGVGAKGEEQSKTDEDKGRQDSRVAEALAAEACVCCCTDAVEGYIQEGKALVSAMLDNNALELLVQRLMSLDEKVCG